MSTADEQRRRFETEVLPHLDAVHSVPAEVLPSLLGVTSVSIYEPFPLSLEDRTLEAAAVRIAVRNFMFAPSALSIAPGTTVIWSNLDQEPHSVLSETGVFRSRALDRNETFSFRFDQPGTYRFTCSIHPRMTGAILVR